MKKSAKLKRKTIKLIVKNLIVFTVLIVVAVVGVRSWYNQEPTVNADGINVKCLVPENLDVAIVPPGEIPTNESQWKKASEILLSGSEYSFLANVNMTQITGDGISFIQPYLEQYGVVAAVDNGSTWDTDKIKTQANKDYLSFDMYMRTSSESRTVKLTDNTYCGPVDPNASFIDGEDKVLPDSVVGSLRMSVTNAADSESRKMLWIPAPNIYFNYDTLETDITDTENTNALVWKDGSTLKNVYTTPATQGTYHHTYWTLDKQHLTIPYGTDDVTTKVTANTECDYKLHQKITIGNMNTSLKELHSTYNNDNYDGYYYDKCRFNIWFEGEDPEARAAQVGGTFKTILQISLS